MAQCSIARIAAVTFAAWLLLLIYISSVLVKEQQKDSVQRDNAGLTADALLRLERASADIDQLRKQNQDLKGLLLRNDRNKDISTNDGGGCPNVNNYPSTEHEYWRRKIETGISELYFYYASALKKPSENNEKLQRIVSHGEQQFASLQADAQRFANIDDVGHRRQAALANLTALMQRRLWHLQNPADCATARKLVCDLNKGCGFGCQLHHVAYCMMVAYGTGRTLILQNDGNTWRYSSTGWNAVFKPISDTCMAKTAPLTGQRGWISLQSSHNDQIVSLPIIDGLPGRPPYLPLVIPADLSDQLLLLHGDPTVWFTAQFVHYLMRSSATLQKRIDAAASRIRFDQGPIVGIQVRRTDKIGTEAAFHAVDEYMFWVERWFTIQSLKIGKHLKRRAFVATDDVAVVDEIRTKYRDYEVFGDQSIASSAQVGSRYSDESLIGVVIDIRMLSKCDYIVCTFSSQVGRLAYELLQIERGDAANWFHSLDDIYYYGGQNAHEQEAIEVHRPEHSNELELQIGDIVHVAGNHWDGYSKGRNVRTSLTGLYPSYKVREHWRIVDFPFEANVSHHSSR